MGSRGEARGVGQPSHQLRQVMRRGVGVVVRCRGGAQPLYKLDEVQLAAVTVSDKNEHTKNIQYCAVEVGPLHLT